MKYLLLIGLLALGACNGFGATNPVTGQREPTMVYCKGKVALSGNGTAMVGAGLGGGGTNAFTVMGDCGDGAYIFTGPPPPNFTPPAMHAP